MAAQNNFCFLILCVFLLFSTINSKPLTMKDREKIGQHCEKETGIDRNIVLNAIKTATALNDDKYLEYLVCSYTLQGYLNPTTNEIIHDNIESFLGTVGYNSDELTYVMKDCKGFKHNDPKQLVFQTLECLLKHLKEVDVMRQLANKNENDDEINKNTVEN